MRERDERESIESRSGSSFKMSEHTVEVTAPRKLMRKSKKPSSS